jgi:signal transduction histidine kinase
MPQVPVIAPVPDAEKKETVAARPPVRSRDHPIEMKVRIEFVRMAYAELENSAVIVGVTGLIYAVALSVIAPNVLAWWWFGTVLILTAVQIWMAGAFRRAAPGPAESPVWGLRFVVTTALTSLAFGALVWIFPTLARVPLRTAHILVLAGITIGKSQTLLPMRKGNLLHVLAIMGPLVLRFMLDGDMTGWGLAACVVVFIIFTTSANLRSQRSLSDALVQRFEREALAAELAAENTRREAHEAEMEEARNKAESANRAKDDFIATISHEIRTPMNGVLGMLRVVRDTELTAEQRSYLRTASDSAESLLLLLNDVLDFSKIEAGRLELERAPFPPATVAKSVHDLLHARARDKGLQFDLHLGENLPGVVIADQGRLRQILVNLLGNAIKFTEKGKVELTVKCVERSDTKAVLHFVVTDSGIGIDSAALERLFKPFTQADSSMSRKYGGTGLGLVISMRLAQAMGGIIQVQSSHGRGSTFQLVLPCPLPDMSSAAARVTEAPKFVTPTLRGRVLVVEDDSVNQQVIDLFLKKMGLTAMFAPDGEVAITTATTQPFDLVLMDCQLPGIDGLEATRQIRKILADKPLLIIALTANASTQVRENCLAAGMNDFLSKPVRFELLAGVLSKHLPAA